MTYWPLEWSNSAKLIDVLHESNADYVTHAPRGFVGTKTHIPHDLQCAHSLLAGQHQMGNFEPVAERIIRALKNRASDMGKTIAGVWRTLIALPRPRGRLESLWGLFRTTARAPETFRPASRDEISAAGIFVREHAVEFSGGKLMDWLGLLTGHWGLPDYRIAQIRPWNKDSGAHEASSSSQRRLLFGCQLIAALPARA
jgi:hypothetical protein